MDEEKEADDDDGYKGGCPSLFSSQKQLRIPPGTAQPTVYGLAVEEAPVETLRRTIAAGAFYNIISQSWWKKRG